MGAGVGGWRGHNAAPSRDSRAPLGCALAAVDLHLVRGEHDPGLTQRVHHKVDVMEGRTELKVVLLGNSLCVSSPICLSNRL